MQVNTSPIKEKQVAISRRLLGGQAPVIINELTDSCLYVALYGEVDSSRIKKGKQAIIDLVEHQEHDLMIIDLSAVVAMDTTSAATIQTLYKTLRLMGIDVIFCGITPPIADTLVTTGIKLGSIHVSRNLKSAIMAVYARQGLQVVPV